MSAVSSMTMAERLKLALDGMSPASNEQAFYYANSQDVPMVVSAMARELLAFRKREEDDAAKLLEALPFARDALAEPSYQATFFDADGKTVLSEIYDMQGNPLRLADGRTVGEILRAHPTA